MLDIATLKLGDVIYESQHGLDYETLVLSDVENKEDGYHFLGLSADSIIPFFQSHDCGAYCLKLYWQPQYNNVIKLDGARLAKALNFYMQYQDKIKNLEESYVQYQNLLDILGDTQE